MRRALAGLPILLTACASSDGLKLADGGAASGQAPVKWEQLQLTKGTSDGTFFLVARNEDGSTTSVQPPAGDAEPQTFSFDALVPLASSSKDFVTADVSTDDPPVALSPFRLGKTYAYRFSVPYELRGSSPAVSVLELSALVSASDDLTKFDVGPVAIASRSYSLALKPCTPSDTSSCSISGVFWFTLQDPQVVGTAGNAQFLRLNLRLRNSAGKVQQGATESVFPVEQPPQTPEAGG